MAGAGHPAVQAEPVEHSMPLASSSISSESPSQSPNVTCALPGSRRGADGPRSRLPGNVEQRVESRSRSRVMRVVADSIDSVLIRSAVAIPTAPATSWVPDLMSFVAAAVQQRYARDVATQ